MIPTVSPRKRINLSHPYGVAAREIVVHGDDVNAATRKRIEIRRQCCNERLSFSGSHLRNAVVMQNRTSDELHVKMSLLQCTTRSLANYRKSLGHYLLEDSFLLLVCLRRSGIGANAEFFLEFGSLRAQSFVRKRRNHSLKIIDLFLDRVIFEGLLCGLLKNVLSENAIKAPF